jgi:aryl-alcohol dehydrogenase-like predicted oxidoreductase
MLNFCKRIGLGGMPLSIEGRPSEPDALKVIEAALELGVDFIDTANVYCLSNEDIGHNERLIAKALKTWGNRSQVRVGTKGGLERPEGAWTQNARPKALRLACEKSLKALGVEQIFLHQLHAVDPEVPLEDSVGEFKRLQEEGKIEHIGLSNVDINQIERARKVALIETVQNRFNPLCQRDVYNGVIETCLKHGMTYMAYSPVGGGRWVHALGEHPTLLDIAQKYAISPYQVMLAFALGKGPHVIAIPGASKIASITDSMKALHVTLENDDLKRISEIEMVA